MSGPSSVGADKRAWVLARAASRGRLACCYCDGWVVRVSLNTRLAQERIATVDHVRPRLRGGSHSVLNLVVCCYRCNSLKSARPLSDASLARVVSEVLSLPTADSLAYWRRRVLLGGQARCETGGRYWERLLASAEWASVSPPGLAAALLAAPQGLDAGVAKALRGWTNPGQEPICGVRAPDLERTGAPERRGRAPGVGEVAA